MSIWVPIGLTLIASAGMNLGLVFLKQGVAETSSCRGKGKGRSFRGLCQSPVWISGLVLLVSGYGLFLLANSFPAAPISLLQPIFASGLLVVALMAVVYLHERFGTFEWLGVALLLAGVILLGVSAEGDERPNVTVDGPWLVVYLCGAGSLGLAVLVLIKLPRSPVNAEVLFGILAGVLLGVGYMNTKTFTLAWAEKRRWLVLLGSATMAVGLLGGLVVLQIGFRRGRALIVTAVNLVINQVVVVAGGLLCLGESFPRQAMPFKARIAGLGAILAGTVWLARFSSGNLARPPVPKIPWQASCPDP